MYVFFKDRGLFHQRPGSPSGVSRRHGWAAGCSFVSGPRINNVSGPVISVAPILFSLPLTYLLALSMKTADAKGIKELINKWQKTRERQGEEHLAF